jgi:hypothetical protein
MGLACEWALSLRAGYVVAYDVSVDELTLTLPLSCSRRAGERIVDEEQVLSAACLGLEYWECQVCLTGGHRWRNNSCVKCGGGGCGVREQKGKKGEGGAKYYL